MSVAIDQLVRIIFQKDSLADCSMDEIQQLSNKQPYFAAAQLLLAKKMKGEFDASNYNQQLEKLSLFIPNPLWIEQLLNEEMQVEVVKKKEMAEVMNFKPFNSDDPAPVAKEEPVAVEVERAPKEEIVVEEEEQESTELTESISIPVMEPVPVVPDEEMQKTMEEVEAAQPLTVEKPDEKPAESPLLPELTFEPYHTVDYFASQGIKFRDEEKPTDKLGKQLKSFTEWLKSMKKLPAPEKAVHSTPQSEQRVEQLAAHSIVDREVVTEAMADVWEKQGNKEKAIDIYGKLSLLNPSKSSYFAAKIEHLKQS